MERDKARDRPPTVGHFERFSLDDPGEIAARMLAKLSDPDPIHVLHDSTRAHAASTPRSSNRLHRRHLRQRHRRVQRPLTRCDRVADLHDRARPEGRGLVGSGCVRALAAVARAQQDPNQADQPRTPNQGEV